MKQLFIYVLLLVSLPVMSAMAACPSVTVSVINMFPHAVVLAGADKRVVIASQTGQTITVVSHPFYSQCGRLDLTYTDTNRTKIAVMLPGNDGVHIRINRDGSVHHQGLHASGFLLSDYIEWHGLAEVLSRLQ